MPRGLSLMWFYVLSNVCKYFMWCEALMVGLVPLLNKSSCKSFSPCLFLLLLQLSPPPRFSEYILGKTAVHTVRKWLCTDLKGSCPQKSIMLAPLLQAWCPTTWKKQHYLASQFYRFYWVFFTAIKILFIENLYWHCK